MLCEKCGINPATVQLTQVINGKSTLHNLCQECAMSDELLKGFNFGFGGMLSQFLPHQHEVNTLSCPMCKMTLSEFSKHGKFGCSECYNTFIDQATPLIKRIHSATKHVGKFKKGENSNLNSENKIDSLKNQLKEAIEKEEYEKAAKLRDEIKEMEGLL